MIHFYANISLNQPAVPLMITGACIDFYCNSMPPIIELIRRKGLALGDEKFVVWNRRGDNFYLSENAKIDEISDFVEFENVNPDLREPFIPFQTLLIASHEEHISKLAQNQLVLLLPEIVIQFDLRPANELIEYLQGVLAPGTEIIISRPVHCTAGTHPDTFKFNERIFNYNGVIDVVSFGLAPLT
jgi:hypothetical protein